MPLLSQRQLDQAAICLGRWWPACLRMIPDLRDDYVNDESETKLAVPFFCQTDWYSCGAVAGWSVLKYFHPEANFRAFYQEVNPLPLIGTSEGKLVRALHRHGVGVSIRRKLSFIELCSAIENGRPVIVGVGHEHEDGDHWIVLYGFGHRPKRIFCCNWVRPGRSREELTWKEFRALWNPFGHGAGLPGQRPGVIPHHGAGHGGTIRFSSLCPCSRGAMRACRERPWADTATRSESPLGQPGGAPGSRNRLVGALRVHPPTSILLRPLIQQHPRDGPGRVNGCDSGWRLHGPNTSCNSLRVVPL